MHEDLSRGEIAELPKLSERPPFLLRIHPMSGWMLLAALQLVLRHRSLPENVRNAITVIAHQVQEEVTRGLPVLAGIAQKGWDRAYDVAPARRESPAERQVRLRRDDLEGCEP